MLFYRPHRLVALRGAAAAATMLAALLLPPLGRDGRHNVAAAPAPQQYLVLIVLDGARPGYFYEPNIPHVRALMAQGSVYTNAWAGILESETPSGHATLTSGTEPRRNGILSFSWAGNGNVPVNLFSPTKIRAGM